MGIGAGLGAGMPIGQQLGSIMNVNPQQVQADDPVAKINTLKKLLENGLITQDEFDNKKQKIIDSI